MLSMQIASKIPALSNLRPETVMLMDGVPFRLRALALPGVSDACESITDVDRLDQDGGLELINVRSVFEEKPDTEERMVVMDDCIIAGGISYQDDSYDYKPDGFGDGNIFHRGRRGSRSEESSFYEALGLDRDGEKDFELDAVLDILGGLVWDAVRKDRSLRMKLHRMLLRHGQDRVHSVQDAIKWAASYGGCSDYIVSAFTGCSAMYRVCDEDQKRLEPLCGLMEEWVDQAWKIAMDKGRIGNPLAVMLDIYEHGGILYSVSGHGMRCPWDTSSSAAIWVPDAGAEEDILSSAAEELGMGQVKWSGALGSENDPLHAQYSRDGGKTWAGKFQQRREAIDALVNASGQTVDGAALRRSMKDAARKYCSSVLDSYNAWVNGQVFSFVVHVIDRETGQSIEGMEEESFGHLGLQDAENALEETLLQLVVDWGRKRQ